MYAFNRGDMPTQADTFNFPHIRLAEGRFVITETRDDYLKNGPRIQTMLEEEGWHHTVLESLEVIHEGPDKVHLVIENTRRRADDTIYNRFKTLWIATLQDGHWGIQFRSSYLAQSEDGSSQ
jgi:hypothetical protein